MRREGTTRCGKRRHPPVHDNLIDHRIYHLRGGTALHNHPLSSSPGTLPFEPTHPQLWGDGRQNSLKEGKSLRNSRRSRRRLIPRLWYDTPIDNLACVTTLPWIISPPGRLPIRCHSLPCQSRPPPLPNTPTKPSGKRQKTLTRMYIF